MQDPVKPRQILVFDYDRTLTLETLTVPESTRRMLEKIRDLDLATLGVVSGRELPFLTEVHNAVEGAFSFLVAENGAVTYFSDTNRFSVVGEEWSESARRVFTDVSFHIHFAQIIGYSGIENSQEISRLLRISGIDSKLTVNKDSIMVCPPGVDKGSGVSAAVEHLAKTGEIELTCFGDGENDVALFGPADVSVAVSNAVDPLKKIADVVTNKPGAFGVEEFLRKKFMGLL